MTEIQSPEVESVTVNGSEFSVPLVVQAATSIVAAYRVDPTTAEEIVRDRGFTPLVGDDGQAGVYIVGVAYLQTDFGRYVEVGVAFDVEPLGPDANASYIHWLPVTGELSAIVGREVWGFPKWVTDLRFTSYGDAAQVEWFEDDGLVLRLRLDAGGVDIGDSEVPVASYAIGPNGPQCTQTHMHNSGIVIGGSVELEIGASGHPAVRALRALGIADLEPALTTRVNFSHSSWGLAEPREF